MKWIYFCIIHITDNLSVNNLESVLILIPACTIKGKTVRIWDCNSKRAVINNAIGKLLVFGFLNGRPEYYQNIHHLECKKNLILVLHLSPKLIRLFEVKEMLLCLFIKSIMIHCFRHNQCFPHIHPYSQCTGQNSHHWLDFLSKKYTSFQS